MSVELTNTELKELTLIFSDLINYDSDDPTAPINPLTYRDSGGDSCIHIAAHQGNRRAVELLLKAGIDVNLLGDMGCTPLHYASMKGHKDIIQLLMKHGAATNIKNDFGDLPKLAD